MNRVCAALMIAVSLALGALAPRAGASDATVPQRRKGGACGVAFDQLADKLLTRPETGGVRSFVDVSNIDHVIRLSHDKLQPLADGRRIPADAKWSRSGENEYVLVGDRVYLRTGSELFVVADAELAREFTAAYRSAETQVQNVNRASTAMENAFGIPLRTRPMKNGGLQFVHGIENPDVFPDAITRRIPELRGKSMDDYVVKVSLRSGGRSGKIFDRDRELAELFRQGPRNERPQLLETHYFASAGAQFVIQRKIPADTQGLKEVAASFFEDAGLRKGQISGERMYAAIGYLVRGLPPGDPGFQGLGITPEQVRRIQASPKARRFLDDIRIARDFATSWDATDLADRMDMQVKNRMIWSGAVEEGPVDFSWSNGRILPDGHILWFDF